jgi:hypothetical protein
VKEGKTLGSIGMERGVSGVSDLEETPLILGDPWIFLQQPRQNCQVPTIVSQLH